MKYNFETNDFEELDVAPDRLAIIGSDGVYTWKELREVVLSLGQTLQQLAIPQGHPVVIYGHKERFFPAAILALIHANIPYIPVDEVYPAERVNRIREIADAQVLVRASTDGPVLDFAIEINSRIEVVQKEDVAFSVVEHSTDNPIRYIMFTSGSTGDPKGVIISAQALSAFAIWLNLDYGYSGTDVFLNQAVLSFDLSVYDFIGGLVSGGTVIYSDRDLGKDVPAFFNKLKNERCSIWTSTPSFVYVYLREAGFDAASLPDIRMFIFIGETLPADTAKKVKARFPNALLINAYGPTEATVATTWLEITPEILDKYPVLPIGLPKRDSDLLINNATNNPKEIGEMVIVGDHVSSGYLNRPDLNASKFKTVNGKKAFHTGDLGCYENGLLFIKGRMDEQVKFNGYRIELDEISAHIEALEWVTAAATIGLRRKGVVKRIVSFVKLTESADEKDLRTEISDHLKHRVPDYMIPGDVRSIEEFPYSVNHKINKLRLAEIYMGK